MHRLKAIKEALVAQVESQLGNLGCVDAEEMGEVVDMIKDLYEACYYHSIVEAMEEAKKEEEKNKETNFYYLSCPEENHHYSQYLPYPQYMGRMGGRLAYGENNLMSRVDGRYDEMDDNNTRYRNGEMGRSTNREWETGREDRDYMGRNRGREQARDSKEGRAGMVRRSYMEGKDMHHDKEHQMKELEQYMQELGQDVTEMIEDATPEEKTLLHKKLTALANKIELLNKK